MEQWTRKNYDRIEKINKIGGGEAGRGPGEFCKPWGVAIDHEDNIYVADTYNHRLQKFNSRGILLNESVGTISEDGFNFTSSLILPYGVFVDFQGNIVVSDLGDHKVKVFEPNMGRLMLSVASNGTERGHLESPGFIAQSRNGWFYVNDWGNHRVNVYDINWNFLFDFGGYGRGKGQLKNPTGITIDSKGRVIVSDSGNFRIQKFSPEGVYISSFGSEGNDQGCLGDDIYGGPEGICVDSYDNILVADCCNNSIQIFDSQGRYLNRIGNLEGPASVALNSKGDIVISHSDEVLMFSTNQIALRRKL